MIDHRRPAHELVQLPGLELMHDIGTDSRDCSTCLVAQDENAHTMRDYLPSGLGFLQGELDYRAASHPAEIASHELICWCGHSLHLSSCKDDGICHLEESTAFGYCRDAWVKLAQQPPLRTTSGRITLTLDPPYIWQCPQEGQTHEAKLSTWEDGERTLLVWCGDCRAISRVDCATGTVENVTDV